MTERQVGLLRGINVAGHNRIAMAAVRALYEQLGCRNVGTYVQSGNVIFDSDGQPAELSLRVETRIKAELGLDIRVIGRTHADLDRIVADDPYPRAEPTQHHVVFLSGEPRTEGLAGLGQAVAGDEAFVVVDGAIHLFLPDGIGRTRLSQALIERRLGVVGTARNWRTVTELHRLSNPTLA